MLLYGCDLSSGHSYQGYVEGENIYLSSPNGGILKKRFVDRGDAVEKDQVLFKLDADPQALLVKQRQAQLTQAQNTLKDLENPRRVPEISAIEAQIAQTQASIELAELRVKRRKELYKRNAIDKDALDAALANLTEQQQLKNQYEQNLALAKMGSRDEQIKAQKAQVLAITEQLKQAQWELDQKTVLAPAAGVIFETYYDEGEYVANQQPVLSLLTPEHVRIEFFVPVQELAHLQVNQKISFLCYGCQSKSTAVIDYISPEVEYVPPLVYSRENDDKLVFRVKANIEQPRLFKPGQPVTVYLP